MELKSTVFFTLLAALSCANELCTAKGTSESESFCSRGFATIESSTVKDAVSLSRERDLHTTRIIPDIKFTCDGILQGMRYVGVNNEKSDNCTNPALQVWRKVNGKNEYTVIYRKITCVSMTVLPLEKSVFSCKLSNQDNPKAKIQVRTGDILGVELPAVDESCFEMHFLNKSSQSVDIPTNYVFNTQQLGLNTGALDNHTGTENALPLITMDFVNDCTIGFLSRYNIISQDFDDRNFTFKERSINKTTRIIPGMKFACNGTLRRMTFAGVGKTDSFSECTELEIQIWRQNGTNVSLVHRGIQCADDDLKVIETNRKYSCRLESVSDSVIVKEGDMLGMVLPATSETCFQLYFIEDMDISLPTNYVFNSQTPEELTLVDSGPNTEKSLPMIAIGITEDPDITTMSSNIRAIRKPVIASVTILIGISIAVLLIVLIVVVVVLIRRNEKRFSQIKVKRSSKLNRKLPQVLHENQNYVSSGSIGTNVYETMNYESMDESMPTRPTHKDKNFPNQEKSLSYEHYEHGFYVPSGEQRRLQSVSGHHSAQCKVGTNPFPVFFEECDTYWEPSSCPEELFEQLNTKKYREILQTHIQVLKQLGAGHFGTVNKGIWQSPIGAMDVAVKTLNSGATEDEKIKFLQEAATNGQFRHPNVVQLLGVVTVDEPTMIVLELMANGDLHNYLNKQRNPSGEVTSFSTPSMLLKFCQQIASGMEYLSKKGFVHRDLAARNILVAEDNTCKISDFGMCRDLDDDDYYVSHGGDVPVKWTAPEAIYFKRYSTASDVWSFGCVMYEIWSLGQKPFVAYSNREAMKMVEKGHRLPPPPGCTKELYSIMIQCWHPQADSRPSFDHLLEMLSKPEFELLTWNGAEPDNELYSNLKIRVVGVPLELGQNLYPTLQTLYLQ